MMDSDLVNTTVNWNVNNQKSIEDAVKVTNSSVNAGSDDIEETVSVESCIHLRAPSLADGNGDEKCTLNLQCCNPEIGLCQLVVVSEAKKLEIYTDYGEYLQTVSTDFIDKIDEDFIVYKGIFEFEKPVTSCVVKFASLRKASELWVYGVRITVMALDKPLSSCMKKPVFDMDKVLQRIQGSDHQLSGKAQNFANFLAMCKKSETESYPNYSEILGLCSSFLKQPENPQTAAPQKAVHSNPTKGKDSFQSTHLLQKYLEQLRKGSSTPLTMFGPSNVQPPTAQCNDIGGSGEGCLGQNSSKDGTPVPGTEFLEPFRKSLMCGIDDLVSRRMQEVEERLWSKISRRFEEIENKQEQQLKTLQHTFETCLQLQSNRSVSKSENSN